MEKEREKERERNIDWLPLAHAPAGGQTHSPGMCPDPELNRPPFGSQDNTQPTEPHQSGLYHHLVSEFPVNKHLDCFIIFLLLQCFSE